MSNTHEAQENEAEGVLRPFVEPDSEPLPPVEAPEMSPPAVVNEPEPVTASDEPSAPGAIPVDELVADIDSLPALTPDELYSESRWTPADDEPGDDSALDDGAGANGTGANGTGDEGTGDEGTDDDGAFDTATAAAISGDVDTPSALDAAEADLAAALDDDDDDARTGTVTLPRTPFLVGLGVLGVVLVALFALWQSSDGDDAEVDASGSNPPAAPADNAEPAPTDAPATEPASSDPGDQETIDALNQQVEDLEGELADVPVAALPGDALERIVLTTDAKFIDATASSIAVVDPHGGLALINPETKTVAATGQVATGATRVLRTESAAWITNYTGDELLWVDPISNKVIVRIPLQGPDGLAKDGGTLIVASYDEGYIARIDPNTAAITETVDVGGSPTEVINAGPDNGLWAAIFDTGEIVQIDPATFEVLRRVTVGAGPVGLGRTPNDVWVANHEDGTVAAVDMATGEVRLTVEVGDGPTGIVGAAGSIWVTVTDSHDLVQLNPATGAIISRTPLGGAGVNGGPTGISVTSDALWVAVLGERSVVRIDREAIG